MDFKNILQEIEKADPEVYEKLSGRRHILKSFGSKVALAALPLAIGSMFKKAYGKTTDASSVIAALNFALELEYFEFNFYHTANNTGGLIPAGDQPGFAMVEAQEREHVNFLTTTITALGGTPYVPGNYNYTTNNPYVPTSYDFTAGGTYHAFESYNTFLILAQTFEDTGVRAYNGQIPSLIGNSAITQAMQISTVEGRHASFVRLIRRQAGASEQPRPWITNNIPPYIPLQAAYVGEDNVIQRGLDLTTIVGFNGVNVSEASASAAFDEPMDMATVKSLIAPFML